MGAQQLDVRGRVEAGLGVVGRDRRLVEVDGAGERALVGEPAGDRHRRDPSVRGGRGVSSAEQTVATHTREVRSEMTANAHDHGQLFMKGLAPVRTV